MLGSEPLKAAMKDATPERTKAMEALNRASSGDKAHDRGEQAFDSGVLSGRRLPVREPHGILGRQRRAHHA